MKTYIYVPTRLHSYLPAHRCDLCWPSQHIDDFAFFFFLMHRIKSKHPLWSRVKLCVRLWYFLCTSWNCDLMHEARARVSGWSVGVLFCQRGLQNDLEACGGGGWWGDKEVRLASTWHDCQNETRSEVNHVFIYLFISILVSLFPLRPLQTLHSYVRSLFTWWKLSIWGLAA